MFLDFEQKKKFRGFIYSKVTLVVLFLLAIYGLYSSYGVYLKKVKSQNDLDLVEKRLSELEQKNRQLDNQIEDLQSPYGIEKEIRSKFFVTKPDEKMVVIVDDNDKEVYTPPKKTGWQKILDFFGI